MKIAHFNQIVEEQMQKCKDTLIVKAAEYSTEDRLHNFMVASEFMGVSPEQVCLGFLSKHLVSISDMCMQSSQGGHYTELLWDEKIGDSINYLLLLSAIIRRENKNKLDIKGSVITKLDEGGTP